MPASSARTGAPVGASTGAYAVLLLTVFIDMVGFGIIIPLLPFWAEHFDATPDLVALLMSVYAAFQFVFAFFWGWLSDRFGRKPILLISLFGSVTSFLLLGLADSLLMIFVSRALGGIMGANIAVAQAYIADVTTRENRAKGMGLLGAAFGMGFILGPALGGLLAGSDPANPDFRTPFYVAAGISMLSLMMGLIFLREPARHEGPQLPRNIVERFRAFAVVIAHPKVAWPILIAFIMGFAMAGLEATYALWLGRAHGWGGRGTGFFFAYIGVLLVIVQAGLVGRLSRRFGEAWVLVAGVTIMMLGFAMVPLSLTVPLI
ncbi:MAG: MFS transporter, partial [Pseudomonadota bacterium]